MKHHHTLRRGISVLLTLVMCLSLVPITALAEEGTETGVEINPTNFPDYVFREYVKNKIDTDGNGTLSAEEIAAVKKIEFINDAGKYLYTLSGIEPFTNLNTLWCINSKMSKLDVSKNTALKSLRCESNQLTTLDVSKNTALESLCCYDNNLTTLNLGENTVLKTLWCYDNQLTKLDVSKNTTLETLWCYDNDLTTLDVSENTV